MVTGYANLNMGLNTGSYVSGLAPGTLYYYRVRATNSCVSLTSNTTTVTTLTSSCGSLVTFNATGLGRTGSLQYFTVPSGITSITIEASAAQGGDATLSNLKGGLGAKMKGTFSVTPGQILTILIGQRANGTYGGGGGGGSFVCDNKY